MERLSSDCGVWRCGTNRGLFARHSCCSSFSSGTERGKSGGDAQLDGGGMKRVISRETLRQMSRSQSAKRNHPAVSPHKTVTAGRVKMKQSKRQERRFRFSGDLYIVAPFRFINSGG